MPHMQDPHFHQSLIYVLDHGQYGAWGVVVNQMLGMPLGDVFEQLDIASDDPLVSAEEVLCGGPVDRQLGMVLHPPGPQFDATRDFAGGVSLSSSRDVLEAIAAGQEPFVHLIVLGHSGWAPGQLEIEIADNAWLTCEADASVIFNVALKDRRVAAGNLLGVDLLAVVGHSGHA